MEDVSLADAKEHLEELVARAARGEDVRIIDPKVGSVRLTVASSAATQRRKPRRLGLLEGKMKVPTRLFEPMSQDELTDWYGREP